MASLNHSERAHGHGTLFGVPLGDLGWFQSLLMGLATGFTAFFLATFLAILTLLFLRGSGHSGVDFAITYKYVGLPVGVLVAAIALGYLGYLWVHRMVTRGRAR